MLQPILIVGTGALACYFAAKISASGQKVMILGSWKESLAAIKIKGIRLIDSDNLEYNYPVDVTNDPNDCKGSLITLVLVKSWQTRTAAQHLSQCLDDSGVALTLQNGLGNNEILSEYLGEQRVIVGSTTIGVSIVEPGSVKLNGNGGITLGSRADLDLVQHMLTKAGFSINVQENINDLLWGKLIINAAINPITALLQIKNGLLEYNPSTMELINNVINESVRVANALSIRLPYTDPYKKIVDVIHSTSENTSSMLYDWMRNAPTEIDAINGSIINYGKKLGIATPYNQALYALVKAHYELKEDLIRSE